MLDPSSTYSVRKSRRNTVAKPVLMPVSKAQVEASGGEGVEPRSVFFIFRSGWTWQSLTQAVRAVFRRVVETLLPSLC
jgi:hypothetical protein